MSKWKLKIEINETGDEETLEKRKEEILKALKEINANYNYIVLHKYHEGS